MKFFNRNFFWGLAAGIFFTIILEIIAIAVFVAIMTNRNPFEKRMAESLGPPPIPGSVESVQAGETPVIAEKAAADYDWSIRTMDGKDLKMEDVKGKTVFINFWATWCAPCRVEMPSIQSLWERLEKEGIVFVCISNEDPKTVSKFIKKNGYTFPVYTIKGEPPKIFQADGIPATFILSPDGKVQLKHVGAAKWIDPTVVQYILGFKDQNPQ